MNQYLDIICKKLRNIKLKSVVIISSLRMLFIYLLLNRYYKDNYFIFDSDIIDLNIKVIKKLKKGKGNVDLFINSLKNYFFFKRFLWKNKLNIYEFNAFGADHISGSSFFLKRCSFYLIEDGTENYQLKNYKRSLKNRLFSVPKFGMHKNVKRIYLTRNDNIPDCIKEKVELINIHQLWQNKTKEEQDEILFLLGIDKNKLENLKHKSIVLFTQPLSEDNVLTEEEKIALYKTIIGNYDQEKLVIKTHPRETTNYRDYFPNIEVFSEHYPSEILDVLGIRFEKVVTIFSTAVYVYSKENIIFYGTKIHPKLLSRFGRIEYE